MFRRLPLHELTLWHIFECLVDGACALTYKKEIPARRGRRGLVVADDPPEDPAVEIVVHADLKPANSRFPSDQFGCTRRN